MDKEFMLDQETADALVAVCRAVVDAFHKLWEEIIKLVRAAADAILEAFKPFHVAWVRARQEIVYQRLRRYYVPDKVARWIARRMVCRG